MVRVLFFGTPEIAVPNLEWLIQNHNVVGAVCQPDKPVGRGYEVQAPPVKAHAIKNNIPVFQPQGPWSDEVLNSLRNLNADIGIVVAYGRIMPENVFSIPKLGSINIHYSLLPKYRGAAPMQWALINGETETGVSAFWLDKGMDSGPVFYQESCLIKPEDNIQTLREKLVPLGVKVLTHVMASVEKGEIIKTPQAGMVTVAPLLKKEMGKINWADSSEKISNIVRGLCEWPGAFTFFSSSPTEKKRLKILKLVKKEGKVSSTKPGQVLTVDRSEGLAVQTGDGVVLLQQVQPEGKKVMSAWDFWQGAHLKEGVYFD